MTTRHSQATKPESEPRFVLPDPPEGEPEDMTSFDQVDLELPFICHYQRVVITGIPWPYPGTYPGT